MITCRVCRKIFEWTEGMKCTKCLAFYHRACLNVPRAAQLPSSSLMCLICETKAQKVENQSTPVRGTYEDYNVGKKQLSPPGSSREDDLLGNAPCCGLAAELKLLRAEMQAMRCEFHELKEKIEYFAESSGTYNTRIDVIEERMNAFDQQHVSLSLREDIKLNVTENAWKPARHKKENLSEEEQKSQELYKKFRGILNKLTPSKFDTLMNQVKSLEINNQKRLEGVIDLVFEKAIDEPIFSEAYAAMCNKLSMLKVPVDNPTTPDKCVNFRGLIISKCQNQFVTDKVDERVLMIEKEIAECSDPLKKKLLLQLEEEKRRVRMRSIGNVRFIGEMYKLKMLTSKIMIYCINYLSEKLDDEKLECLCVMLTTIGEQVDSEAKEQLDNVFMRMQEIVYLKSNVISNRVRFMIQDVIELRKRRWVTKSVVDSQPKTMDQIQREQRQQEIEIMNAAPMSRIFWRDEDGRGKRVYNRRQNSSFFMDNSKKPIENNWRSVDTPKLSKESKGVIQKGASQSDQSSLSKADLVSKIKARLASVDSKKAQELGGVFLFNIMKGTSVYSWTLDLNKVVVYEGEPEEDPDTTFTLSEQIFKQLVQGREDPRVIMQAGRCSVTGDIMRAMKLEPYIKLD